MALKTDYAWWRFAGGWTMEPELYILRIPKAASSSLVWLFQDLALLPVHEMPLTFVPEGKLALAVLRDPLERFRSGWDQHVAEPKRHLLERFPTIDHFVEAGPEEWMSPEWGCGYWRSAWWLLSAEYVRERGAIVFDLRTFSDDVERMGLPRPKTTHPSVVEGTVLSQRSRGILREYYDPDYRLMEELWT